MNTNPTLRTLSIGAIAFLIAANTARPAAAQNPASNDPLEKLLNFMDIKLEPYVNTRKPHIDPKMLELDRLDHALIMQTWETAAGDPSVKDGLMDIRVEALKTRKFTGGRTYRLKFVINPGAQEFTNEDRTAATADGGCEANSAHGGSGLTEKSRDQRVIEKYIASPVTPNQDEIKNWRPKPIEGIMTMKVDGPPYPALVKVKSPFETEVGIVEPHSPSSQLLMYALSSELPPVSDEDSDKTYQAQIRHFMEVYGTIAYDRNALQLPGRERPFAGQREHFSGHVRLLVDVSNPPDNEKISCVVVYKFNQGNIEFFSADASPGSTQSDTADTTTGADAGTPGPTTPGKGQIDAQPYLGNGGKAPVKPPVKSAAKTEEEKKNEAAAAAEETTKKETAATEEQRKKDELAAAELDKKLKAAAAAAQATPTPTPTPPPKSGGGGCNVGGLDDDFARLNLLAVSLWMLLSARRRARKLALLAQRARN